MRHHALVGVLVVGASALINPWLLPRLRACNRAPPPEAVEPQVVDAVTNALPVDEITKSATDGIINAAMPAVGAATMTFAMNGVTMVLKSFRGMLKEETGAIKDFKEFSGGIAAPHFSVEIGPLFISWKVPNKVEAAGKTEAPDKTGAPDKAKVVAAAAAAKQAAAQEAAAQQAKTDEAAMADLGNMLRTTLKDYDKPPMKDYEDSSNTPKRNSVSNIMQRLLFRTPKRNKAPQEEDNN